MLPPFQRLLDDHASEVYRFLVAAAGPQDADDCFQETFLAALRAYPRVADASNLRGWLLTIAGRKVIDAHRARGRRPYPVEEVPDRGRSAPEPEPAVWDAVRDLPPKQRAAVVHRYLFDRSHAEIGRLLGCSEEAARRSVHEGMRKLREVPWT